MYIYKQPYKKKNITEEFKGREKAKNNRQRDQERRQMNANDGK